MNANPPNSLINTKQTENNILFNWNIRSTLNKVELKNPRRIVFLRPNEGESIRILAANKRKTSNILEMRIIM